MQTARSVDGESSARFDRQMAIRNGRPADAIIRRVQGTDYVSCLENGGDAETCNAQFPADTCTINPDGSATCSFVAGTPSPTAPNGQPWPSQEECNNYSFYIGIFQIYFGLVWFFFPEAWFLMAGWEAAFAWLEWYVGCA